MNQKPTYEDLVKKVNALKNVELECKKTLSLLKESEKKYKDLLEGLLKEKKLSEDFINSLPGLFYVLDRNGMVRWNREWNIVGGYADNELAGIYGTVFFEGADRERAQEFAINVFRKGASHFEADFLTKSGRRIPYYFTGIRKKLNGKDHLIGLGLDITDRKQEEKEKQRLQQQLHQSYRIKAIGTLAGGIAHKFNNALCEITGNIELFKRANPDCNGIDKYMDRMLSSVRRMSDLSNHLLAYAEEGKYQPKIMSLCDLIDITLPIVIGKKPATAARVETDIPSGISRISGDQAQIQMIVSAVIENALEAIDQSGRIRIILRNEIVNNISAKEHPGINPGPYVCLRVIDNGKGMDEEAKRRIFEPFFTTHIFGRGLGMAAAYGIVKNHDGWIDVESQPGKGTVVSIYLPAADSKIKGADLTITHRKVVDRRQYKRFQSRKDVYVFLKSFPSSALKLIDISKGGMACIYRHTEHLTVTNNAWDELAIHKVENEMSFEGIPCKIISDQPRTGVEENGCNVWQRCGIRLGELSKRQSAELDALITAVSIQ